MSDAFSPASAIAAFTANVAIDRVVCVEPRLYSVSPTPTIAYLSRRNFGVDASTLSGIGIGGPPVMFVAGNLEGGTSAMQAHGRHANLRPSS
jgi:hypothetical protein